MANRQRKYTLARCHLILGTNIFGFVVCYYLGKDVRFYTGYFCVVATPILLFGSTPNERKYILPLSAFSVLCYFILDYLLSGSSTPSFLPYSVQRMLRVAIDITTFMVTFLSVHYLSHFNRRSEYRLKNAQAALMQSSKLTALGEMAAGVAHEINSPLATMKILSGQIQDMLENPSIDKKLLHNMTDSLIASISRVASIVTGLRNFSRDGGQDPCIPTSLADIVQGTISLCQERFRIHGIDLVCGEISTDWTVSVRSVEIAQALLNLLNNAFEALEDAPKKRVEIVGSASTDYIDIRVIDSGKGIAEEIREKIFQPFFTTKEIGKGTGLGLSVSAGLVRKHGGSLFLDTKFPSTCFVIRLPRHLSASRVAA